MKPQNADKTQQEALILYKPLSTIRELITTSFILQIIPNKRVLLTEIDSNNQPLPASSTNKRYRFFPEPSVGSFPFGFSYEGQGDWDGTAGTQGEAPYYQYLPGGVGVGTGANVFNSRKINGLKTKQFFPYEINCAKLAGRGFGGASQLPLSINNPPDGSTSTDPNSQPLPPWPTTNLTPDNDTIPRYGSKFYPPWADYNPPVPFPNGLWDTPVLQNNNGEFTISVGSGGIDRLAVPTATADILRDVLQFPTIPGLMGTRFKVDLREQQTKLNDIRGVDQDKIMWVMECDSCQVVSDGRALASSRLIATGRKSMEKYLNGRLNYNDVYTCDDDEFDENTQGCNGFGYPVCWTKREVLSQPINIGVEEINTVNNPIAYIINSQQGSSLDRSAGSLSAFGKFPYSQLTLNIGHYLREAIGDPTLPDNECNKPNTFMDLNNEWFSSVKDSGGALHPVFYNQSIESIQLKFSIKTMALF